MILQALKEYYDRKAADPDSGMAPDGWEWREFEFLALIDEDGTFLNFQDLREGDGTKKRGHRYLVPALGEKKGNGIKANLFWENIEYTFGVPVPTKAKPNPDEKRVAQQHEAYCSRIRALEGDCPALVTARKFTGRGNQLSLLARDRLWEEILAANPFLLLAIRGKGPVTNDPELRQVIDTARSQTAENSRGLCLVSGSKEELSNLEPPIKGVRGAQSIGSSLVSFNLAPFNSYGKEQGENAPVGRIARFAYASALNHLLGKDSRQRVQVGDATTVFWAARNCELEELMSDFFDEPPKDDPDRGVNAVESLLKAVETGVYHVTEQENKFFVLGLAPNSARLAIRFWVVDTVEGMAGKIAQHFRDLAIVHAPHEKDSFSLFRLLVSLAALGKADNIPPNLAGDTMRAILAGVPYPKTLLQAAVRRNRAEQSVTYIRAALIKACINREIRFYHSSIQEELKMALDPENDNIGYRLGRLFATLEKIQQEASPGINATIRDRFYGAASSTPVAVFGNLMRLKNHHLAKLENPGRRITFEKLLGEVVSGIDDFPAHLPLSEQGRFAIGYYHQMQDFFTKKEQSA